MPLYTYECTNCGHTADKLVSLEKRSESIECSKCKSKAIRVTALPSPPKFKGDGFTKKFHK